jgi:hypothetical protein
MVQFACHLLKWWQEFQPYLKVDFFLQLAIGPFSKNRLSKMNNFSKSSQM